MTSVLQVLLQGMQDKTPSVIVHYMFASVLNDKYKDSGWHQAFFQS